MGLRLPAMQACPALICISSKVPSRSRLTALPSLYFASFAASAVRRCSGRKTKGNTLTGSPLRWAPWTRPSRPGNSDISKWRPRRPGMKFRISGHSFDGLSRFAQLSTQSARPFLTLILPRTYAKSRAKLAGEMSAIGEATIHGNLRDAALAVQQQPAAVLDPQRALEFHG